jgi:hypothetical protein
MRLPLLLLGFSCSCALLGCARGSGPFADAGPDSDKSPITSSADAGSDAGLSLVPDTGTPQEDAGHAPHDAGMPHQPPADAGHEPDPELDAGHDAGAKPLSECAPGTYSGTFSGIITALPVGPISLVNIPITGNITIDALTAESGDTLVINNGKVTGSDQDGNPVTADVQGSLDCATKTLLNGALMNGLYVRKAINYAVNFDGVVEATYHPGAKPSVSGTWKTKSGLESGSGPFNAVLE